MIRVGRPDVWFVLGLLVLLNLGLYWPSLDNGFSLDDFNWLERAAFRASTQDFVLQPEPGQILNPVPRGLFLALYHAAGTEPLPYRAVILALHVLASLLLWALIGRLAHDSRIGVLAAVLFSLHTAYDEALFWIAAFFHPLATVLVLATLLAFMRFLDRPRTAPAVAAAALFLAGCLTKASAFTALAPAFLCLLLPGLDAERRRCGGWLLAGLVGIAGAVLAVNLAAGAGESYLLERGYYRFGPHLAANLGDYVSWLLLPFAEVFSRLGLDGVHTALLGVLRWIGPAALVAVVAAGSREARVPAMLALAGLTPFLPFVFEPVSRYTYLASVGVAGAAALLLDQVKRAPRQRVATTGRTIRVTAAVALGGLLLVSAADTRLRDNHYEHRERLMAGWIDDVARAVPRPEPGATLQIIGLPRLAIDPGIHLEAALRLHYDDPGLVVRVVEDSRTEAGAGVVLEVHDGRIRQARGARRPGAG